MRGMHVSIVKVVWINGRHGIQKKLLLFFLTWYWLREKRNNNFLLADSRQRKHYIYFPLSILFAGKFNVPVIIDHVKLSLYSSNSSNSLFSSIHHAHLHQDRHPRAHTSVVLWCHHLHHPRQLLRHGRARHRVSRIFAKQLFLSFCFSVYRLKQLNLHLQWPKCWLHFWK